MQALSRYLSNTRHMAVFFFVLAGLLYANTIPNRWAIDDGLIIHNSNAVRKGFPGIPALMSGDFLESSTGTKIDAVAGSRYRPLTPVIFASLAAVIVAPATDSLGNAVTGSDGIPLRDLEIHPLFPHVLHILNVLTYAILCAVLYLTLLLILKDRRQAPVIAFLTTLFYTVHPLHTEAVANAKGLDEILAMLFALLSMHCAILGVDGTSKRALNLAGSGAFLLLACLSKENAVTFVAIVPLTLWFFRDLASAKLFRHSSPLLLSAALYLTLRVAVVGTFAPAPPDPMNMMNDPFLIVAEGQQFVPIVQGSDVMALEHPTQQSIVPMPAGQRLATIGYTWLQYLKLFVAPVDLSYDYYPGQIGIRMLTDPPVLLSLLIHAAALIWGILNLRRRRLIAYGILFYVLSFSIVSNLLISIGTNMAERFLFMPSLGLCLIAAAALEWLSQRFSPKYMFVLASLSTVLLAMRTVSRNFDWKDNFTLIGHDLEVAVNSAKIRSDYGEVVLRTFSTASRDGNDGARLELLRSTLPLYKQALDVYPMYGLVWFNLGRTCQLLGESEQIAPNERLRFLHVATAAFGQAAIYKPRQYLNDVDTLRSLSYAMLGKLYGQEFGDVSTAIFYLRTALAVDSRNAYANFLLATAHDLNGATDSAEFYARAAYDEDSDNRDYMENYAQILQKNGMDIGSQASRLQMAEGLLLEVARRNAAIPPGDPKRAALDARTGALLEQNRALQQAALPVSR